MSWQLYAALGCAGFFLLSGGKKARRRKKKKSSGKFILTAMIAGGLLAVAGGGGAALGVVTTVTHHHAAGSNIAIGQQLAASYGWTGSQWNCLYDLWDHESGWIIQWNHAGSGAFGIPQALPASKMASAGADWMTNPATQIKWGLGYIRSVYGDPCTAWSDWQARSPHWY